MKKIISSIIAIGAIASACLAADETKSLLPAFGPDGTEVKTTAKGGNTASISPITSGLVNLGSRFAMCLG